MAFPPSLNRMGDWLIGETWESEKNFSLLKLDALNTRKLAFIVSIQRDPVLWMGKLCESPFVTTLNSLSK